MSMRKPANERPGALGTLGFHVDGTPCRVGCAYCYLGARPRARERALAPEAAAEVAAALPARELAISLSEPALKWRPHVEALAKVACARELPLAITTTLDIAGAYPWVAELADRVSLSVDPAKGARSVDPAAIAQVATAARSSGAEVVALASLVSKEFSEHLAAGLLAALIDIEPLTAVALNGLKPPPPWCDASYWRRFCARVAPLLDRHLGRKLVLDCYVSARIFGLGDCPAKPDVAAGREFRSCVYQRDPDFVFADAEELARRLRGWQAPARCPFPIV
jgi:pyruvate-formate lyase-activating enzyme